MNTRIRTEKNNIASFITEMRGHKLLLLLTYCSCFLHSQFPVFSCQAAKTTTKHVRGRSGWAGSNLNRRFPPLPSDPYLLAKPALIGAFR